jgi:hypothetical protein
MRVCLLRLSIHPAVKRSAVPVARGSCGCRRRESIPAAAQARSRKVWTRPRLQTGQNAGQPCPLRPGSPVASGILPHSRRAAPLRACVLASRAWYANRMSCPRPAWSANEGTCESGTRLHAARACEGGRSGPAQVRTGRERVSPRCTRQRPQEHLARRSRRRGSPW